MHFSLVTFKLLKSNKRHQTNSARLLKILIKIKIVIIRVRPGIPGLDSCCQARPGGENPETGPGTLPCMGAE